MFKKLISLSLVAVMLAVTAFASADVAVFTAAYAAIGDISAISISANELTVGGSGLQGSATLSIASSVDKTAIVVTAVYNPETDALMKVIVGSDLELTAGETRTYTETVSVADSEVTEYDVNFYLWEKSTLDPLCEVSAVNVKPTPWDGTASESLAVATASDLNGNYEGYYMIKSAKDLAKFATIVNGGETTANAVLCNDIYFNTGSDYSNFKNSWGTYMIGNKSNYYAGTFDGNGKTIYGLYISAKNAASGSYGLFGEGTGCTIKDLNINNPYIVARSTNTYNYYCSPVIAKLEGGSTDGTTPATEIKNVNIIGGLVTTGSTDDTKFNAPGFGSFVGLTYQPRFNVNITNCHSTITIDTSNGNAYNIATNEMGLGAMVGSAYIHGNRGKLTIDGCSFAGHINVPGTVGVGAVIGHDKQAYGANTSLTIKNCSGDFTASDSTTFNTEGIICGIGTKWTDGGGNTITKATAQ